MPITIRPATVEDIPVVVKYNRALATETEDIELDASRLETGVRRLIEDPRRGSYFLAEIDGLVVGQTMITLEWSDWRNGDFWWIQSVYVAAGHRGRGVFGALYRHIEALAKANQDICGIRLYVDNENHAAATTYRKLGMQDSHYNLMEIEFNR